VAIVSTGFNSNSGIGKYMGAGRGEGGSVLKFARKAREDGAQGALPARDTAPAAEINAAAARSNVTYADMASDVVRFVGRWVDRLA